jgi:hypothetical protein
LQPAGVNRFSLLVRFWLLVDSRYSSPLKFFFTLGAWKTKGQKPNRQSEIY